MATTFFTLSDGTPRAIMGIRRRNNGTVQPLEEAVPDGDTAGTQLDGTGSVRFLGVDAPEKSFEQPVGGAQGLDGAPWDLFLTNPLRSWVRVLISFSSFWRSHMRCSTASGGSWRS